MEYSLSTPEQMSFSSISSYGDTANSILQGEPISARELRRLPKEERSARLKIMFFEAAKHFRDDDIVLDASDILER